jgi:hypothetical protein
MTNITYMYNTLSLLEKPNQMIHAQESTQKWWGEMQKLPMLMDTI